MSGTFKGCCSETLINLALRNLNLNNIKNMNYLFSICSKELNNKIAKLKIDLDNAAFDGLYFYP